MRILLSRTDAIGDVILTLPMAALVKKTWPHATVGFLCQNYARDVVKCSPFVDEIYDWKELSKQGSQAAAAALKALSLDVIVHVFPNRAIAQAAKMAKIPKRIGTSRRFYHWLTCNVRLNSSRKKSDLHEAQLNCQLLLPLGAPAVPTLAQLQELSELQVAKWWPSEGRAEQFQKDSRPKIILHTGSRGSARNWPLASFVELAQMLSKHNALVFLTGTEAEGQAFRQAFPMGELPFVIDVSGTMTLTQLIGFVASCNALVAASTGPLHIAAALGVCAIGLYPPLRPMHPGRWGPLGKNVQVLSKSEGCSGCPNALQCACMQSISPQSVLQALNKVISR